MNALILLVALGLSSAGFATLPAAPQDAMPATIASTNPARHAPVWVSARNLLQTEEKSASSSTLFTAVEQSILDSYAGGRSPDLKAGSTSSGAVHTLSKEVCQTSFAPPLVEQFLPPHRSFDDLIHSADTVVVGRISAVEPGFFGGIPQTLVRLEVDRAIGRRASTPTFFVVHPEARFSLGSDIWCTKSSYGELPETGRRALLFLVGDAMDPDGMLIHPPDGTWILEVGEGGVLASAALSPADPIRTAESFSQLVEETLEAFGGRCRIHPNTDEVVTR